MNNVFNVYHERSHDMYPESYETVEIFLSVWFGELPKVIRTILDKPNFNQETDFITISMYSEKGTSKNESSE